MRNTPWGDADGLREKRLRPGAGVPATDVAKNQRQRLFAAMVATVDEKGFEATTVADLLALSGISRTTFYEHFDDKRDCFAATVEAVADATAAASTAYFNETPGGGEAKMHALFDGFVEMVVAQPEASRMCFVESYAAGPGALSAVNRMVNEFKARVREAVAEIPGRRGMPEEMRSAIIGALYQMIHARLYRRQEQELRSLAPEIWEWAFGLRPPPHPLVSAPLRRPSQEAWEGGAPTAPDPAERIIRGFAAVSAEKEYPATTIAEIVDRASVSQSTFYSSFKGRKEVLLSAIDSAGARMMAAMLPAARRGENWPESMRLAIGAMTSFGVAEPGFATLLANGVYAAGPVALVRRDEVSVGLQGLFASGYELSPETAPITAEASVSLIYALMYNQIKASGPQSLPAIAPIATYLSLAPFIGADRACSVANGQ